MRRKLRWALLGVLASAAALAGAYWAMTDGRPHRMPIFHDSNILDARATEGCEVEVQVSRMRGTGRGLLQRARSEVGLTRPDCSARVRSYDASERTRPRPQYGDAHHDDLDYDTDALTDVVCADGRWVYGLGPEDRTQGSQVTAAVEVKGCRSQAPCPAELDSAACARP